MQAQGTTRKTPCKYKEMKKVIIIALMQLLAMHSSAQFILSGQLTDESAKPLAGAHVSLSSVGATVTDHDGKFVFNNVSDGKYSIKFSFVGYEEVNESIVISGNLVFDKTLTSVLILTDEVVVTSTRAFDNSAMTYTMVSGEELQKRNMGQDLPIMLDLQPAVVTTSDAGAGIGYTGIRIRGSDATRINVTINGIPLNDPESQGVFWVNLPDLSSSVDDIQIQRGVGTSTNGAGAFGATLNIKTTGYRGKPYAEISNSIGSFNSRKHTLSVGTGLVSDHFVVDARLSRIYSDGYIDRAYSDLSSYFTSAAYYGKATMVKFNIFAGKEKTYQAWWGVPESRIDNDVEAMNEYIINNGLDAEEANNLLTSGRTYNYYTYDNEIDNYQQNHYQFLFAQDISSSVTFNAAFYKVHGEGYFEQFRKDDDFADYGLDDVVVGADTITSTDLIRRRWLNNDFYGTNMSFDIHPNENLIMIAGGAWSTYQGAHYGEIIWAEFASNSSIRYQYYNNLGDKDDLSVFVKGIYSLDNLHLFGDLQVRSVGYQVFGIDNDRRPLNIDENLFFFNPKFGATVDVNTDAKIYASISVGNREPVRNDYIDAPTNEIPTHETLVDFESGYKKNGNNLSFEANVYYMAYKNQLVLTGELNDVGSGIRKNVDNSYRAGIELQLAARLGAKTQLNINGAFSSNKIEEFEEVIYDYGVNWDEFNIIRTTFANTDLSFSPSIVAGGSLSYFPSPNFEISFLSKYVGKQYLDNTSNPDRAIDAFFKNDIRMIYTFFPEFMNGINISLLVNNVFNSLYESNGYTYGYIGGGQEFRENLYYPQAGINFLASLVLKF